MKTVVRLSLWSNDRENCLHTSTTAGATIGLAVFPSTIGHVSGEEATGRADGRCLFNESSKVAVYVYTYNVYTYKMRKMTCIYRPSLHLGAFMQAPLNVLFILILFKVGTRPAS